MAPEGQPQCTAQQKTRMFFEVTTTVLPSPNSTCTSHEKELYGNIINRALREAGVADEDVSVVGKVCVKPGSRRQLLNGGFRRQLDDSSDGGGGGNWGYNGGGGCSYCSDDDDDRRELFVQADPDDEALFDGKISNHIEDKVKTILSQSIHTDLVCAGKSVSVVISTIRKEAAIVDDALFCTDIDTIDIDKGLAELDDEKEEASIQKANAGSTGGVGMP